MKKPKQNSSKKQTDDLLDLFGPVATDAVILEVGSGSNGYTGDAVESRGDDAFIDMAAFAERSYLTYAMSVVLGRAIPNIQDGQKPVQRRILHVMNELGLKAGGQHTKSARIVGEVLGKFHPHGDASTYEALVRMAQDFSLRYPLIDGQGNFGTQDGDSAAAYRYTEARLTPIADLLLSEIDQDTVDWKPNYDGRLKEPELLPARLPMLLLNGASGVGVGMACELPPHNLREVADAAVAMIKRPHISIAALMNIIQGPDFPGGSKIISPRQAIIDTYGSGRGSLRARCQWKIENLSRGQWQIVVYELPPTTSSMCVMAELEALTNPKPRNKSGKVSPTQANLRQLILNTLDKVNDESDKSERVRLVFEPRSSKLDPDEFMQLLMTHTSLEENFPINMVVIGIDGKPQRKTILQLVKEWVDFRLFTIRRRAAFRLYQIERRMHILQGRHIVLLNIDKVIKVIRSSDEPKSEIIASFKLTVVQADDILEIRLRQLARLEGIKIETELRALSLESTALQDLLSDENKLKNQAAKEIQEDARQYGDARRTLIEESGRAHVGRQIMDEELTVIISKNGWVRTRQGHGLDLSGLAYKNGDGGYAVIETSAIHKLVMIDSNGRCFSIAVADLHGGKGDGVPLTSLVDMAEGARVAHVVDARPGRRYLMSNSSGYGFVVSVEHILTRMRSGKTLMTLLSDETVIRPAMVTETAVYAVTLSAKGKMLMFPVVELKEMERGRGVKLMELDQDEKMIAAGFSGADFVALACQSRTGKESTSILSGNDIQKHILHRARKGCLVSKKFRPIGIKTLPTADR